MYHIKTNLIVHGATKFSQYSRLHRLYFKLRLARYEKNEYNHHILG